MKKIALISTLLLSILIVSGCESFRKPDAENAAVAEPQVVSESEVAAETETNTASEKSASMKSVPAKTESKPAVKTEVKVETKAAVKVPAPATPKPIVKSFTITAKQFEFTPSTLTVNEGDTVKITLNSKDVTHGLVIPDFGINKVIAPGGSVTVEFVANKKGTFKFRCSVSCGEGHAGMTGTLVVK